jgi:radical SAM superfamily enzyme YgiQ (UPF0313 family)
MAATRASEPLGPSARFKVLPACVFLINGNAQPLTETELAALVKNNDIKLAGIGAMTRMALRAYCMADAIRSAGAKVVMGGPHVTEVPDEPLGRTGGQRHVDAVALGEADETWPRIVNDTTEWESASDSCRGKSVRVLVRVTASKWIAAENGTLHLKDL